MESSQNENISSVVSKEQKKCAHAKCISNAYFKDSYCINCTLISSNISNIQQLYRNALKLIFGNGTSGDFK
jgi:hypothetical protein